MGQRHLPKELQTQKTKSLSKDLKSIAEELIADKFDVKEEVVAKEQPSFRQEYGVDTAYGPDETVEFTRDEAGNVFNTKAMHNFRERQQGYRNEIEVVVQPWSSNRVAELRIDEPTFHSLVTALRRFDRENMRHERKFVMDLPFVRELMARDRKFSEYFHQSFAREVEGAEHVVGKIFGCDVVVSRGFSGAMLTGSFR